MNWFQKIAVLNITDQAMQIIPGYFPSNLRQEILFWFEMYVEGLDGTESIQDPSILLYTALQDILDHEGLPRKWVMSIRQYMIELGVYRAYSPEELQNVYSIGKKYDFKMNGQSYLFEQHPEGFR